MRYGMARPVGRERTVCESCELPYYADGEGCPYCGGAVAAGDQDAGREGDEESGIVFGSAENASAGGDGDGSDGLVGRLKRTLGL